MTEVIVVGLIAETIGEKDNGVEIASGMEMLENESDQNTAVGTTTLGMFEVVYICLVLVTPLDCIGLAYWALRFSTSLGVSSASTILPGVIWSLFVP